MVRSANRGVTRLTDGYRYNKVATLSTQAVTEIAATSATGNGTLVELGAPNPTQHGFCWNTSGTPTTEDAVVELGEITATTIFEAELTELTPATTYFVRAFATNTAGTAYGDEVTFATTKATPTVTQWPTTADIIYGQVTGAASLTGGSVQFNGTQIAGAFAYDTPEVVPSAGTYEAALTFSPEDTDHYNTVSGTVQITVERAIHRLYGRLPQVLIMGRPSLRRPYRVMVLR